MIYFKSSEPAILKATNSILLAFKRCTLHYAQQMANQAVNFLSSASFYFQLRRNSPHVVLFVKTTKMEVNNVESGEFQAVPKRKAAKRKVEPENVADASAMEVEIPETIKRPSFPPVKKEKLSNGTEVRKIPVPTHRYSPLKENWMKIFTPIVEHLHLQVRFNLKVRQVEIRTCKETEDISKFLESLVESLKLNACF